MGRPKGSKNKPKQSVPVVGTPKLSTKSNNTNIKQPTIPSKTPNPNWKAPEDFVVTTIPLDQWGKLKPGRRVKTHPSCVVGGLVFTGTIISRDPNSEFVRVNWDVKGSQAAHWKTISLVDSPLEVLPKPVVTNNTTIPIPTAKPSNFKLPEQLPEQAPKRRGRPPGSKNKVKHK